MVLLPSPLQQAILSHRLNRFAALVEVAGQEVLCHVANSGRMRELFVPGYRVLLKPRPGNHRKTRFDLALVDLESGFASADARLPNALVAEALEQDPEFFAFRRSLEAYGNFLKEGTTVVLSADSDLFQYLESPNPASSEETP